MLEIASGQGTLKDAKAWIKKHAEHINKDVLASRTRIWPDPETRPRI